MDLCIPDKRKFGESTTTRSEFAAFIHACAYHAPPLLTAVTVPTADGAPKKAKMYQPTITGLTLSGPSTSSFVPFLKISQAEHDQAAAEEFKDRMATALAVESQRRISIEDSRSAEADSSSFETAVSARLMLTSTSQTPLPSWLLQLLEQSRLLC